MWHHLKSMLKAEDRRFLDATFKVELLTEVGDNLVQEWQGDRLTLSAEMGFAVAFTCLYGRPNIHSDRTSVAYST